MVKSTKV